MCDDVIKNEILMLPDSNPVPDARTVKIAMIRIPPARRDEQGSDIVTQSIRHAVDDGASAYQSARTLPQSWTISRPVPCFCRQRRQCSRHGSRNLFDFAVSPCPGKLHGFIPCSRQQDTILDQLLLHEPTPRVLVVDDNVDAADILATLLSVFDCTVQVAYSGSEALALGEALRPQLVILDLDMPGMDGCEAARRMREQSWGPHACIVALTAWSGGDIPCCIVEAGMDYHFTKPMRVDALVDILAALRA